MPNARTEKQLNAAIREAKRLLKERDSITAELVRKLGLIRVLSSSAGEGWDKEQYVRDIAARICQPPSIADAVLLALRISRVPMKPTAIRDCLVEWGYDLRKYTFPMAAVHSALRLLIGAGKVEIIELPDSSKLYVLTPSSRNRDDERKS